MSDYYRLPEKQRLALLRAREKELDEREASLREREERAMTGTQLYYAWPILLRALRREGILTASDLNEIRFADQRVRAGDVSVERQIERALDANFQERENKRKRADEH